MSTKRLTMAQALILYLQNQYVERDGKEQPFFAGCWGIFGHGNVAGIGQALQQSVEKWVRQKGGERLVLETSGRADYERPRRFYERAGFTRCAAFGSYTALPPSSIVRSVFFEKHLS